MSLNSNSRLEQSKPLIKLFTSAHNTFIHPIQNLTQFEYNT